jgi:hypothetical protein
MVTELWSADYYLCGPSAWYPGSFFHPPLVLLDLHEGDIS